MMTAYYIKNDPFPFIIKQFTKEDDEWNIRNPG